MTSSSSVNGREAGPLALRRILCAVDLSDFSAPALAHGVAWAEWFGAAVTALHVVDSRTPPEARAAIERELALLIAAFESGGTPLTLRTVAGDPAREIVRCAEEIAADLIVMGTHGRSGYDRVTLGSVATP